MDQHELLRYVASALDRLKIPYFVTGSFAGILYGLFRMTNDSTLSSTSPSIVSTHSSLRFHWVRFTSSAMQSSMPSTLVFNSMSSISSASLRSISFVAGGSSHEHEEFRRIRRIRGTVDYDVAYCSPEDIILNKLRFHVEGDSQKHLDDIVGILKMNGPTLDVAYIEQWADWLDVLPAWRNAQKLSTQGSAK